MSLILSTSWCLILVIHLLLVITFCVSDCPRLCDCKWKSGKETVLCQGANLSAIPARLDAGTQVLDLTANEIGTIGREAFSNAGLLNLQKIFLVRCRLRSLDRYSFLKLSNLVELDLSYNLLSTVPSHALESTPELRELKLSGNPIQRISNDAFTKVPQLVRLELSDCRISMLETNAFAALEETLEWLKMDGNRLVNIRASTLTSLHGLHGIELAANPWNCTCGLRPLREWMLEENVPCDVPPVCRFPTRLSGKTWDRLELDEFACAPEILAPDPKAHGVEGRNITMRCKIGGVPEPSVRWSLRNRVIANLSTSHGRKTYVVRSKDNEIDLTITGADAQDAGIYTCAAENKAGRAEASVTLAVSRKTPEAPLSGKMLMASLILSIIFVTASCLIAICFFRKRKRHAPRWNNTAGRNREDSYEKIEMNHKAIRQSTTNGLSSSPSSACPTVAMVQPVKRRGKYLHVPTQDTEDEDPGYEDDIETPTPSTIAVGREIKTWKTAAGPAGSTLGHVIRSPTDSSNWTSEAGSEIRSDDTDLHIPRLSDLRPDSTPESGPSSTSGQYNIFGNLNNNPTTPGNSGNNNLPIIPSTHHPFKPPAVPARGLRKGTLGANQNVPSGAIVDNQQHRRTTSSDGSDSERNYPDLLDTRTYGVNGGNGEVPLKHKENAFCTLPRKRGARSGGTRYYKGSDSESPLLQDSRYSSNNSGSITESGPPPYYQRNLPPHNRLISSSNQRSNSFLNLSSSPVSSRDPPSLPTSPVRSSNSTASATPLLNINNLNSRADHALVGGRYDYHSAQLERFLDEYRCLRRQLTEMKETCDGLRIKSSKPEAPIRTVAGGASRYVGDNASDVDEEGHPDVMKSPVTPVASDPPASYWLPRNSLMKRFGGNEFFQS